MVPPTSSYKVPLTLHLASVLLHLRVPQRANTSIHFSSFRTAVLQTIDEKRSTTAFSGSHYNLFHRSLSTHRGSLFRFTAARVPTFEYRSHNFKPNRQMGELTVDRSTPGKTTTFESLPAEIRIIVLEYYLESRYKYTKTK